jgi:hypothetical protein
LKAHIRETERLDFKEAWTTPDKAARTILALANCGGGCIVYGVRQEPDNTFYPSGLGSLKDKSDIRSSISKYLPDQLVWNIFDFLQR